MTIVNPKFDNESKDGWNESTPVIFIKVLSVTSEQAESMSGFTSLTEAQYEEWVLSGKGQIYKARLNYD